MSPDPKPSLLTRFDSDEMRAAYGQLREEKRALIDYQQFMELHGESAIDPDVIHERGYQCVSRDSNATTAARDLLKRLGFPGSAMREDRYFPGLLIPLYDANGDVTSHMWKPRVPVPAGAEGKTMKYVGVRGRPAVIDVHPRLSADRGQDDPTQLPYIKDIKRSLWITEGTKKADAMVSRGFTAISLSGVYNWRSGLGTLGDWEDIPLKGREVFVCFDADMIVKKPVQQAANRLKKWLKSKGAKARMVYLPAEVNGTPIKGIDDYFNAGGEIKKIHGFIDNKPPKTDLPDSEIELVEYIAEGAILGAFIWTTGLGWLAWNGLRWVPADDEQIVERVRSYVIDQVAAAAKAIKEAKDAEDINGQRDAEHMHETWCSMRSYNRLSNAVKLLKGIEAIRRDAQDFDSDPDVLNTPAGLLHLESLIVEPHHHDHLVTRITTVDYVPGAESHLFKEILSSLPAGTEDYAKARFGQAITGHTPDDSRMVMLTGGGGNGKSILMETLTGSLGDVEAGTGYAIAVAPELLLSTSNKGAASPEKMDLKGARLAYMEETPEDRYLSVTTLKQVVGTKVIKGRHLYKDMISWRASHSLFLNTNFPPRVVETDDGSWRRLARMDFPFRFRFDNDGKGERQENDRDGSHEVKRAVDRGDRELLTAALAWMVEGANAWYETPLTATPMPEAVLEGISRWRRESDYLQGFIEACMEPSPNAWVTTEDFYSELKTWMETQKSGKSGVPDLGTVKARLDGHNGLGFRISVKRVLSDRPLRSLPPADAGASVFGSVGSASTPKGRQTMGVLGLRFAV
jgi:P4 family phage/plasmid primase-like protien